MFHSVLKVTCFPEFRKCSVLFPFYFSITQLSIHFLNSAGMFSRMLWPPQPFLKVVDRQHRMLKLDKVFGGQLAMEMETKTKMVYLCLSSQVSQNTCPSPASSVSCCSTGHSSNKLALHPGWFEMEYTAQECENWQERHRHDISHCNLYSVKSAFTLFSLMLQVLWDLYLGIRLLLLIPGPAHCFITTQHCLSWP